MKAFLTAGLLLLAFVAPAAAEDSAAPPAATVQAEADLQADLQALYDRIDTARMERDAAALQAMLSPDFVSLMPNGRQVSRRQVMKTVGEFPEGATVQTTVMSVERDGDRLAVSTLVSAWFPVPGGGHRSYATTSATADAWVPAEGGSWRLAASLLHETGGACMGDSEDDLLQDL